MSEQREVPQVPETQVSKGQGVVNWPEIAQFAIVNDAKFREVCQFAHQEKFDEVQCLRLLVCELLRDKLDIANEHVKLLKSLPPTPKIII